jgi:L-lactate dehydrogenase (cytochrome)
MFWPRGEAVAARAAGRKGVIYTASTMSICSMEEIAEAATGAIFYQLYVWRDRDIVRMLIERAKAAGYRALVVTVDTPVLGQRERDVRSGLVLPPRLTAMSVLDTLRRVSWLRGFLTHPRPTFGNFVGISGVSHDAISLATFTTRQFSASIGWDDIEWYRSLWPGPIALKGIMSPEDARRRFAAASRRSSCRTTVAGSSTTRPRRSGRWRRSSMRSAGGPRSSWTAGSGAARTW